LRRHSDGGREPCELTEREQRQDTRLTEAGQVRGRHSSPQRAQLTSLAPRAERRASRPNSAHARRQRVLSWAERALRGYRFGDVPPFWGQRRWANAFTALDDTTSVWPLGDHQGAGRDGRSRAHRSVAWLQGGVRADPQRALRGARWGLRRASYLFSAEWAISSMMASWPAPVRYAWLMCAGVASRIVSFTRGGSL
jgi:hypothetical protein